MEKHSFGIKNFSANHVNPYFQTISSEHENEQIVINKSHFKKLIGLSRTSLKVLEYFINYNTVKSETIHFNLKQCIRYTGFNNKRSVYNALTELLGEQLIARANNENIYYLNTDIIITSERR